MPGKEGYNVCPVCGNRNLKKPLLVAGLNHRNGKYICSNGHIFATSKVVSMRKFKKGNYTIPYLYQPRREE